MSQDGQRQKSGELRRRVDEVLAGADAQDHPNRLKALQAAVQIADEGDDLEIGYRLRFEMIDVGIKANRRDVALVCFAWCLNHADKQTGGPGWYLLWRFKWVIGGLTDFSEISREQVLSTLEDMAKRYQDAGYGLKAYHQLKLMAYIDMGDFSKVQEHLKEWSQAKNDGMADCKACQINALVCMHAQLGELDKAVKEAKPLLEGSLKCEGVPEATVKHLLFPLTRAGRVAEAREWAQLKVRRVMRDTSCLVEGSHVMAFTAVDDHLPRALKMLETLSRTAGTATNAEKLFHFACCGHVVLKCLEKTGRKRVTLRLDAATPGYDAKMVYVPGVLAEVFMAKAKEWGDAFNRRNGNDFYTQTIAKFVQLAEMYPLPQPEPGDAARE